MEKKLIKRATELIPLLRKNAKEASKIRRVPDANVEVLQNAGLYQTLLSKRFNGYQQDLHTHLNIVSEVSRGCGSTGWCLGITQIHSWLIAQFPQQTQEEIYGTDPKALVSAVLTPRGISTKTKKGWRLNGFWPNGSHSQHSQWLILGTQLKDGDQEQAALCVVPTDQIEIKDDWHVGGLRGTGSCSLVAQNLIVPEHRVLLQDQLFSGQTPGAHLHEGTLYHSAAVPVLALPLAAPAIGIAKMALEEFSERLGHDRTVAYTYNEVQREMPTTHMQVAEAAIKIDAAEALLHQCAEDITQTAQAGKKMDLKSRARVRMHCGYAVRLCLEATEKLFLASGGSGLAESNPIQRAAQDLHAVNLHGILVFETNLEMYGRLLLGLPQNSDLI